MPRSMDVLLTLKYYRCFSDEKPVSVILRNGFTSIIGVNNSGKSSFLKFFHEFRLLFQQLSVPSGSLSDALVTSASTPGYGTSIKDRDELFCNLNSRDLVL